MVDGMPLSDDRAANTRLIKRAPYTETQSHRLSEWRTHAPEIGPSDTRAPAGDEPIEAQILVSI
jgi:hypothetical protein